MGIENMRRWPMYIVFAVSICLLLSLFNSWSVETELRNKISEISIQLQDCNKQQAMCLEESLTLTEQRDRYMNKVNDLNKQKGMLQDDVSSLKKNLANSDSEYNRTLVDVKFCKAELQSLKNLQLSKSATLETLRLEKDTLTTQLAERKQRIEELEKEIQNLKLTMTSKSVPVPVVIKVTPAPLPPKLSPALNLENPINKPMLENDAKEELEDPDTINDGNDLEPQIQ